MRQIKFRYFQNNRCFFIDFVKDNIHYKFDHYKNHKTTWLQQWTGVCDKNGVDIYEGDLVKVFFSEYDKIDRFYGKVAKKGEYLIGEVKYNNKQCKFEICFKKNVFNLVSCDFGWGREEFEIVGNIYNNSELLVNNIDVTYEEVKHSKTIKQ